MTRSNEPNPLPEGWRRPNERELAQQTALKLSRRLKYFGDGWRRWHMGQWWPCDSYGRRAETLEVIHEGRTKVLGIRKPIDDGEACSVKQTEGEDQTQEPDMRVGRRDRTGEFIDE